MIYQYDDNASWLAIVAAVFVVEIATIVVIRPISANSRVWYKNFGIVSVIADVGIILLDFAVSRYMFSAYPSSTYSPWVNATIFSATLLWLQIVHDLLYYHVFIRLSIRLKSTNGIVLFMRQYGSDGKVWPVFGDSVMVVASGILAHALSLKSAHVSATVLISALYIVPYMVCSEFIVRDPPAEIPTRAVKAEGSKNLLKW